ncbi:energy transducer TonB [Allosphingosinicella flava]|uniref:Energy transducer TonB n=1 Tax=Allosphingosinicella flava TaxID=2771430 RepID=A0A7T2GI89_9SPHN|nr:energy transducer TonB [Sphingosinicella flava]QPQ54018.1 energy transducer TonB [Sphingosinicella flava]
MAYVDQKMSSSRITAIVIVALLHALLGYAFISGLALRVAKQAVQDLKTFDVIEEPPPPEEEPPPPVESPVPVQPPPVVSPPPIVRTNTPPPLVSTVNVAPPAPITYTAPPAPPSAPVAPPAPPPPPRKVETAKAKANLASYVSNDDYPPSAVRNEEEGTTGFRLEVGANGRVTSCTVTSPSGSRALDDATCRIMRSRARFTPARDSAGNPTTDTVSNRITWRLER